MSKQSKVQYCAKIHKKYSILLTLDSFELYAIQEYLTVATQKTRLKNIKKPASIKKKKFYILVRILTIGELFSRTGDCGEEGIHTDEMNTFCMILLQKLTESTESLQRHIYDVTPVPTAEGSF